MKVKLIKDKDNKVVGWDLIRDNDEEAGAINTMRNMLFFGMYEDVVEYDGMDGTETQVETLKFRIERVIQEERDAHKKRLREWAEECDATESDIY